MAPSLDKPPVWMVAELRRRTGLPLLECRRLLFAATPSEYKRIAGEPGSRARYDPAEDDPAFAPVLLRAALEADAELADADRDQTGFCHLLWGTKRRILRDRYGVRWRSPAELNPAIVFD